MPRSMEWLGESLLPLNGPVWARRHVGDPRTPREVRLGEGLLIRPTSAKDCGSSAKSALRETC
jgi:hypothetical protein